LQLIITYLIPSLMFCSRILLCKIKNHINFNLLVQSNYNFTTLWYILWYLSFNPIKVESLVYLIVLGPIWQGYGWAMFNSLFLIKIFFLSFLFKHVVISLVRSFSPWGENFLYISLVLMVNASIFLPINL
jgi:hypothetical protein